MLLKCSHLIERNIDCMLSACANRVFCQVIIISRILRENGDSSPFFVALCWVKFWKVNEPKCGAQKVDKNQEAAAAEQRHQVSNEPLLARCASKRQEMHTWLPRQTRTTVSWLLGIGNHLNWSCPHSRSHRLHFDLWLTCDLWSRASCPRTFMRISAT